MGLSQYRQRAGSGRRLVSGAGPQRLERLHAALRQDLRRGAPRLASLGYDAVSLAVSLSQIAPGERYSSAQLTRSSGFAGVDGLFRLLPDGTCERGLAILEVHEGGPQVIDPAPSSFATASSY